MTLYVLKVTSRITMNEPNEETANYESIDSEGKLHKTYHRDLQ